MKKLKKTTVLSALTALLLTAMSFDILDDNGKAGSTGSPSEGTCNQSGCHNTYTLNSGGGSVIITAPTLTDWKYVPGQTYAINVTVAKSGISLFGLGFEALNGSGANAGTLTAGTGTTIKSATVGGNSRSSIVQNKNAGATANTHTFTFNWKAPATNIGNITFYCAGNAANKNGTVSGDYIYTTSQVVTPTSPAGTEEELSYAKRLTVFPNPATDHIQITNTSQSADLMTVSIFDLNGALVSKKQQVGSNEEITLGNLSTGIYALRIESSKGTVTKQFIKK